MSGGATSGEPASGGPHKPMDPRTPAFALCVCALVILVGTFSKNWASAGRGIAIGPTGVEACLSIACSDIPWRDVSGDIELFATLSWIGGLAAAAACAAFGGLFLAEKSDKLPAVKVGKIALSFAAVVMTYFELRLLSRGHGMSWAPVPAIGGAITAMVMLRKLAPYLARPAPVAAAMPTPMPMPMPPPMLATGSQEQPPRSCPRCGTRLSFVQDKQRWFCVREQEYL